MDKCDFWERFMAALIAGDSGKLGVMLDPDFSLVEADGLPYGGTYRGVQGCLDLGAAIGQTWKGYSARRLEFVSETDDCLVIRLALAGTSRKTGVAFETTLLEVWRFKGDKLSEILPYYWDTHLLSAG